MYKCKCFGNCINWRYIITYLIESYKKINIWRYIKFTWKYNDIIVTVLFQIIFKVSWCKLKKFVCLIAILKNLSPYICIFFNALITWRILKKLKIVK